MKTVFTGVNKFLVTIILLCGLSGCIVVDIKGAGVFKKPIQYMQYPWVYTDIDIPRGIFDEKEAKFFGEKDGSKIQFGYLGSCGGGIDFSGIMIPFFPVPRLNSCVEEGFYVFDKKRAEILGVTFQLHYNGMTHDSYVDKSELHYNGGSFQKNYIEFKIPNFLAFKNAKDKTLIIHKKKPDGTMWSKELPFDWKIVVSVEGGL
jgi:hypothetical protein